MRSSLRLFTLLSIAVLTAPLLVAQSPPMDVEVGYRWLSDSGNEGMYRTLVNERSGFLLRAFTMTSAGTGLVDQVRVDASDLGAGPAGVFRLEATGGDTYRLRLSYRDIDAFSALPAFANPLLSDGFVPGEHTFNRTRRMFDVDLDFLPNRNISPFLGYSFNTNEGPGTTTYFLGGDEFRLRSALDEKDREIRGGAAFRFGVVSGQVTQGWRHFRGDESLTLAAGANNGNNSGSILGHPINSQELTRSSRTKVDTPFTSLFVTALPIDRLRVTGDYNRFSADTSGVDNENALGSFVSFPISRFFDGFTQDVSARAKNTTWRGGARAEYSIGRHIDLLGGARREHRELTGAAVIESFFLDTITFGGANPGDIETLLNSDNSLQRNSNVFNVGVVARALGPWTARAEYIATKQDIRVSEDLAEIVVPGGQGGRFDRRIDTVDLSTAYTRGPITLGAAWRHDSADRPILRTDFDNRDRIRLRGTWRGLSDRLMLGAVAESTEFKDDRSGIGLDGTLRQYSADADFAPKPILHLRGSFSRFTADNSMLIRFPQNFENGVSLRDERGNAYDGGFSLALKRAGLDASFGRVKNNGTIPFTMNRVRTRATYDFTPKYGMAAEWSSDDYSESLFSTADFNADRYGLFLRYKQ